MDSVGENASNSSSNSSDYDYSVTIDPISLTWEASYALSTALTNAILLYILIFKIKDRNYSNMCFISLGFNDMVIGVIVMPTNVFYSNPFGELNYYLGVFITTVSYAQTSVGLFTLVLPTWHRFKQLAWPIASTEKMNMTRKFMLIAVWVGIYSIWVTIVVVFIFIGLYDSSILDITPPPYVILLIDLIFYILPMIINVILTLLTMIMLVIRRNKKQSKIRTKPSRALSTNKLVSITNETTLSERRQKTTNLHSRLSRDTKAILCLVSIIACIVLTQIVYVISWPIYKYGFLENDQLYFISVWISFANSFFNPFILIVFHDSIQKALISMFTCSRANKNGVS